MRSAQMPDAADGYGADDQRTRRTFRSADGVVWTVREREAGQVGSPPPGRSLVFESDMVIRRVRHYPPNWRSLPDAELERLSWTT